MAEQDAELVERVAQVIHTYCCRNMVMTYLDADEDCTGIARAVIPLIHEAGRKAGAKAMQGDVVDWLQSEAAMNHFRAETASEDMVVEFDLYREALNHAADAIAALDTDTIAKDVT